MLTNERIRVGGMAMPDGVFMRTDRAWAIARADGSVQVGPVKPPPLRRIPVLRLLVSLVLSIATALRRAAAGRGPTRRPNKRFLLIMVGLTAAQWWLASSLEIDHQAGVVRALWAPVFFAITLAAMKVLMPSSLWRYHGAEHKAIAAYEQSVALDDLDSVARVSPIHDRCGTNLVFLIMLFTLVPMPSGWLGYFTPWLGIGAVAEVMNFAIRRHASHPATRLLLAGGRGLQRAVTIREPNRKELGVGVASLQACLNEHERLLTARAAAI